ncbi:dienelactone hydrolase family protein [Thermocoleostomius sinensis]|uniref:Dienelactone hydrolase family protein n=1 Tax=Thermocoleostomius sinensis A174 TaxID=2016057 RepID=A0A9E9C2Q1_9CYAN|nr:dienelactone hydrolase family protein [Thermocoleostomius sinensis]WAL58096.1 dienelactone hydrolase family protein [Thermocoleostomius sinensis A174]
MRKWIALALLSCVVVLTVSLGNPGHQWAVSAQGSSQPDYSQQMMHSHEGDRPVASPALAFAPTVPVTSEEVTYGMVDGRPVMGYLARPTDAAEPLPGLIVIHEWWGLNDNIRMMTDRLAGEGYTALAVDLYGGQVAEAPEQARQLTQAALQTPQTLQENLRQAYQYLETEQQAPKIASIGWCFGGSWSLNTALQLPDQLAAAVIYYGGQLVTDPEQLQSLQMPILGVFGELDDNPSPETVYEFKAALDSLGKSAEIYIYEGADHAFANPSGTRYNPEVAEDAWQRTIAFLDRHLKGTSAGL